MFEKEQQVKEVLFFMKLKTDLVIMGSGMAGISAADAALARGKKVIVFEKKPYQGGAVSNCPIAYVSIRKDRAFQNAAFHLLYEYSNYNANPSVIRQYVNNSWRTKEYIERLGIKMIPTQQLELEDIGDPKYADGFPPAVMAHGDFYLVPGRGKGHGGALICLNAMKDIIKRGGQYMLNTPITDILVDENGKVTGVKAVNNETKEEIEVECEAVIIASGGIMEDREMMKKYTGFTFTDYNCSGDGNVLFNCYPNSDQTGDGQKLAWKLGGAQSAIAVSGHNLVPGPGIVASSPWIVYNETRTIQEQPYLWVNKNGERFIDESISNNHMAISTGIANQPNGESYIVFDEDTRRHLEEEGVDYMYFIFPVEKLTDIPGQFRTLIEEKGNKHVFMKDTIEELCAQSGIDQAGLEETLDRYNGYCDNGEDEEFGKNAKYLRPVRKGPFYAMRVFCAGYDTIGGIKVNGKMQVIREDGKAIPGLYAAGDNMMSEFYGNPPTGGSAGAYFAMPFGFAAGDSACDYLEKNK